MDNIFQQGQVHKRPQHKKSQAFTGIEPLSPLIHRTQKFQGLPSPIGNPPYHYNLGNAVPELNAIVAKAKKLVFHTVGDVGGVKNPDFQASIAAEMKRDLYNMSDGERPLFFFLLGDVVYYNGQYSDYYSQFYEPYDHYNAPILAIPGNHDGDPAEDSQTSLDGWIKYFMTTTPHVDPISKDAPRVTLSLPNVYYTINAPFATIIGLYTNVPEHGSVDSQQLQWLTNEFLSASADKALIVAMHHPIYSFDDHHSGSPNMADVLEHAINESRRLPNLVLTAHVHNYQRIEKTVFESEVIPFFVAGNGGYYHLHNLTVGNGAKDSDTDATLVFGDDKQHGYVTLCVDETEITGYATLIDRNGSVTKKADSFVYTAKKLELKNGQTIKL